MRKYYTLIQSFHHENERDLAEYLVSNKIDFDLGADFASELRPFGFTTTEGKEKDLLKKFVVLVEEYELSAIQLSVGGVTVIRNRTGVEMLNKLRGCFKWFVK